MVYEYECDACGHKFEISQGLREGKKRKCPECKRHKLRRLFGTPMIIVKGVGQTIQGYAEDNVKRVGKTKIEELEATKPRPQKKEKPWWRETEKADKSLGKMTPQQQKNYIETGAK